MRSKIQQTDFSFEEDDEPLSASTKSDAEVATAREVGEAKTPRP